MKEILVTDLLKITLAAKEILHYAANRKVFTLTGDLGAGKTTLTQAVCKALGVRENVTSPTFSLVNEYSYLDKNGQEQLFRHLDLYRLKSLDEALDIGIEDYLEDGQYCFIEWPEIIEPLLPNDVVKINITILNDSSRKILIL
ncbi:MAG: tRNA (adenosine(37)-N6)-threonylcarbamoyltransferase complex ATPase subunit type 1 TsaE [Saprospiraceae bacterium]